MRRVDTVEHRGQMEKGFREGVTLTSGRWALRIRVDTITLYKGPLRHGFSGRPNMKVRPSVACLGYVSIATWLIARSESFVPANDIIIYDFDKTQKRLPRRE